MNYFDLEFIRKKFSEKGLPEGNSLGSKSNYRENNPENRFISNAIIYQSKPYYSLLATGKLDFFNYLKLGKNYSMLEKYQIWHGDLDLIRHHKKLEEISREIKQDLVITDEYCVRKEDIITSR